MLIYNDGMDAEDFKQYREAQQERRAKRLPVRQQEIENLAPDYDVKQLTPYQYRINGTLDLFPIHQRWHNIKTNKRGHYHSPKQIVKLLAI